MTVRTSRLITSIQTLLVLVLMAGLFAATGYLVAGIEGIILLSTAGLVFVSSATRINPALVLRAYGARRFDPETERYILLLLSQNARAAGMETIPLVYTIPRPEMNAFSLGNREKPAIALTAGLVMSLGERELRAVLAHELGHIAHGDLYFMRLADMLRIVTDVFSMTAQIVLLFYIMTTVLTGSAVSLATVLLLLVLVIMPYLNLALRGFLSRTREYSADLFAARTTGDPLAMASALSRIEAVSLPLWRLFWIPSRRRGEGAVFRSHPPTEKRVQRLMALARETQGTG